MPFYLHNADTTPAYASRARHIVFRLLLTTRDAIVVSRAFSFVIHFCDPLLSAILHRPPHFI